MINIGTNFEYQGDLFLDGRQGEPLTKNDLLNWSIPIPEGFEVCLDKTWYTYNSTIDPDQETGYFHKRIDYEYSGSIIEWWINYILSLLNTQPAQQLQFKTFSPNDQILEVNSSPINLTINWSLKKGSNDVTPTNATVNGSTTGVSPSFNSFTQSQVTSLTSPGTKTFAVKVWGENNETVSRTLTISYKLKKYWGVSSSPSPNASEITGNTFASTWAGSWTMNTTIFDCSGGKYPYYVIPASDYNASNFTMWVNGLVNSDLLIEDITINQTTYKRIRTNIIQTGQLRIEFKL